MTHLFMALVSIAFGAFMLGFVAGYRFSDVVGESEFERGLGGDRREPGRGEEGVGP